MSGRDGFSLVELLIALVIAGVSLAVSHRVFSAIIEHRETAVGEMEGAATESIVRRTLAEWLREAIVSDSVPGEGFEGSDAWNGFEADDRLVFTTSASASHGSSKLRVHLYVDRTPSTPESGLVADVLEQDGRSRRIEIVPAATGLDIAYLFAFDEPRWYSGWISASKLPLGLKIILSGSHADSLPPLLRQPLTVQLRNAQ
jgi:prepilin-type N-terminal cleavage/methylation domain-containing protein